MQFKIRREDLLKPLQFVCGVVERRQTMPILAHILVEVQAQQLALTGTDLEIELIGRTALEHTAIPGKVTIPARKLLDICRSVPEAALLDFYYENQRVIIKSGRSRFMLATLAAEDFPSVEDGQGLTDISITQRDLRELLEKTYFAMAQQDVRYYLNGLLLEVKQGIIYAVATDGHRMALNSSTYPTLQETHQVIIPRKGILELLRLLEANEQLLSMTLGTQHFRIITPEITFTSKLIDGRFPDYEKVVPRHGDKIVLLEREQLKQSLSRVAILANEKNRGVCLMLEPGILRILAHNLDQEEAQEEIIIDYQGAFIEIGFNVTYLLDVLSAITDRQVTLTLSDANSSMLIQTPNDSASCYVIMPMRL